jgi:hypothetical protein
MVIFQFGTCIEVDGIWPAVAVRAASMTSNRHVALYRRAGRSYCTCVNTSQLGPLRSQIGQLLHQLCGCMHNTVLCTNLMAVISATFHSCGSNLSPISQNLRFSSVDSTGGDSLFASTVLKHIL